MEEKNESVIGSDSLLHYSGNYDETHKYSLNGSTSLSSYGNYLSYSMSIVNSRSLSIRELANYSNITSASEGFSTEQSKLTSESILGSYNYDYSNKESTFKSIYYSMSDSF